MLLDLVRCASVWPINSNTFVFGRAALNLLGGDGRMFLRRFFGKWRRWFGKLAKAATLGDIRLLVAMVDEVLDVIRQRLI